MSKERAVMVFHAPLELYEETQKIASEEMISISSLCRKSLKDMIDNYKIVKQQSDNNPIFSVNL